MASKLYFSENIPKEMLEPIKAKFLKYEKMIPNWCEQVRIYWRSAESGDEAISGETVGHYDYRWARITICAGFIDESEFDRDMTGRHELAHVIISPLINLMHHVVSLVGDENPKVKEFIEEQFREKLESVTQDISTMVESLVETNTSPKAQKKISVKPTIRRRKKRGRK